MPETEDEKLISEARRLSDPFGGGATWLLGKMADLAERLSVEKERLSGRLHEANEGRPLGPIVGLQDILEHRRHLERLLAAAEPFTSQVRGIPPNWPGRCVLTFDETEKGHHRLSYLGEANTKDSPTIDDWRRLAKEAIAVRALIHTRKDTDA